MMAWYSRSRSWLRAAMRSFRVSGAAGAALVICQPRCGVSSACLLKRNTLAWMVCNGPLPLRVQADALNEGDDHLAETRGERQRRIGVGRDLCGVVRGNLFHDVVHS